MYQFRELRKEDQKFLKEMLYQALYVPEGETAFPRSILENADLSKYYQDWGKPRDIGILVEKEGENLGIAWARLFSKENQGYGYVDDFTPELDVALLPAYRGQGLGKQLLNKLLEKLKEEGYTQVSLSVNPHNKAMNLYKKLGFIIVGSNGASLTMLKKLD